VRSAEVRVALVRERLVSRAHDVSRHGLAPPVDAGSCAKPENARSSMLDAPLRSIARSASIVIPIARRFHWTFENWSHAITYGLPLRSKYTATPGSVGSRLGTEGRPSLRIGMFVERTTLRAPSLSSSRSRCARDREKSTWNRALDRYLARG